MRYKKHQSPQEFDSYDPQEYRTGTTAPRKSYSGIIAALLVAVIILGGAVSILGIMNIQLFWQLAKGNSETLPFMLSSTAPEDDVAQWESLPSDIVTFPWQEGNTFFTQEEEEDNLSLDALQKEISSTTHGIYGEMVSTFKQNFYQLPKGLYITEITPGSCAAATGLRAGDIILAIDGHEVTHPQAIQAFFDHYIPGAEVTVTLYRNGEIITMTFCLPEIDH